MLCTQKVADYNITWHFEANSFNYYIQIMAKKNMPYGHLTWCFNLEEKSN